MRYIVNNFSPQMVAEDKYTAKVEELNESEFMHMATIIPYTSLINDKGIAEYFDFEYCKKHPKFHKGDWILTVIVSGGTIPEDLTNINQFTNLRYYIIEIMED